MVRVGGGVLVETSLACLIRQRKADLALNVERLFQHWRVELESIQRTERDVLQGKRIKLRLNTSQ